MVWENVTKQVGVIGLQGAMWRTGMPSATVPGQQTLRRRWSQAVAGSSIVVQCLSCGSSSIAGGRLRAP